MEVLVIGAGGREHALAWKLKDSPRVSNVWNAPGNGGTPEQNVDLAVDDHEGLVRFARDHQIGMAVVGPDDALAAGLVDVLESEGIKAFGPKQSAARLESSKIFAKEFMQRHGIPTAAFGAFDTLAAAEKFLENSPYPVAVKADGLALGKGVVLADTREEALRAVREMMAEDRFGEAGKRIVIEEFLHGRECSMHLLMDGRRSLLFPSIQDHKRLLDGDQGPNTGGMGTFSPSPAWTVELEERIDQEILKPLLRGLAEDGIEFRGLLYPGLMLTEEGPKVLEFNCRFGDPETQALMPRLKSDLFELLEAAAEGRVDTVRPEWDARASVCVVLASGGYPGAVKKGIPMEGLEEAAGMEGINLFHAGTKQENGRCVTAGGRVLGVTALGETLRDARDRAYLAAGRIRFDGCQYRRDIAAGV